jgi:hypothetical protein
MKGGVILGCSELKGTLGVVCAVKKGEGTVVGGVTDSRSLFFGDAGKKGVLIGELDIDEV